MARFGGVWRAELSSRRAFLAEWGILGNFGELTLGATRRQGGTGRVAELTLSVVVVVVRIMGVHIARQRCANGTSRAQQKAEKMGSRADIAVLFFIFGLGGRCAARGSASAVDCIQTIGRGG
jgi:hypothetical protein